MCDLGSITDAGGIWEGDPLRPPAAGQYIAILASANTCRQVGTPLLRSYHGALIADETDPLTHHLTTGPRAAAERSSGSG